jgi:2-dehydro-3-deoxyphosphogluconate aldolase/(4S)-4-hydroxy-2-oxoglutarate aldolase
MDARELLQGVRVVPVVVIEDVETAVPLARTLLDAGLGAIEVTLRTAGAVEAIGEIVKHVPEMLTGAGSIRNGQQLLTVIDAGAQFGVGPGFSESLLDTAEQAEWPFIPGSMTPSESIVLLERGYSLQKFFPAGVAGGTAYLKSVAGPLPEVSFMPTGGIRADNARSYLDLPNVACIGGSWIVSRAALRDRDYASITETALDASRL